MRFAKRCECKEPLTISEDDYCSLCSRFVGLPDELPPDPGTRPESLAISMYESKAPLEQIKRETGLSEFLIWKLADPEKYRKRMGRKLENQKARRARWAREAQARRDRLKAIRVAEREERILRRIDDFADLRATRTKKQLPDRPRWEAAAKTLKGEDWTLAEIARILGIQKTTANCLTNPSVDAKQKARIAKHNRKNYTTVTTKAAA